jgi:hypothetical protein
MTPFSSVVKGTTSSLKPFAPVGAEAPAGQCSTLRILDPDVYDAIELFAEIFGGIGAGRYWGGGGPGFNRDCPVCVHGGAAFLTDSPYAEATGDVVSSALGHAGVGVRENDLAVRAINTRLGVKDLNARVPFELWRQELCIVRGPHPDPDPAIWGGA